MSAEKTSAKDAPECPRFLRPRSSPPHSAITQLIHPSSRQTLIGLRVTGSRPEQRGNEDVKLLIHISHAAENTGLYIDYQNIVSSTQC